jgi:hypothetical protein
LPAPSERTAAKTLRLVPSRTFATIHILTPKYLRHF